MNKAFRQGVEDAQALTAKLVTAAIEKRHPTLQGQVVVKADFTYDWYFRVRETDGGKAKVMFGIGAKHPRFVEMVLECAKAAYEIRFTGTEAVEIRK